MIEDNTSRIKRNVIVKPIQHYTLHSTYNIQTTVIFICVGRCTMIRIKINLYKTEQRFYNNMQYLFKDLDANRRNISNNLCKSSFIVDTCWLFEYGIHSSTLIFINYNVNSNSNFIKYIGIPNINIIKVLLLFYI